MNEVEKKTKTLLRLLANHKSGCESSRFWLVVCFTDEENCINRCTTYPMREILGIFVLLSFVVVFIAELREKFSVTIHNRRFSVYS